MEIELEAPAKAWNIMPKSMKPMVNEAKFTISKECMEVNFVDPAHVSMGHLKFYPAFFNRYVVGQSKEKYEVGIDIDVFEDKLKGIKPHEKITMKTLEGESIIFLNTEIKASSGDIKLNKQMKMIDCAGMPDPKIPNLDLPFKFEPDIPITELKRMHKNILISDHTKWTVDEKCLTIVGADDETRDKVIIPVTHCKKKEPNKKAKTKKELKKATSLFSDDYGEMILKIAELGGKSGRVKIELGNDNPMVLTFAKKDFWDSNKTLYEGMLLLAPRIESE